MNARALKPLALALVLLVALGRQGLEAPAEATTDWEK